MPGLDLQRLFSHGGLPIHYLVEDPAPLLRAYVNSYIKEEIIDEAATRNVPAFEHFLLNDLRGGDLKRHDSQFERDFEFVMSLPLDPHYATCYSPAV